MAALTDYAEAALINELLRGVAFAAPATVYLALFTTATTDAGGGTESTGGSYARQAITFAAPVAGTGTVKNSATVTFTNMPASTVTHAAIFDALTGGNMLFHGALSASKTFTAGDNFSFAIDDIAASLS